MALTLNGSTRWPSTKELHRLGETRMGGAPAKVKQILARIDESMTETMKDMRSYIQSNPSFSEIGDLMLKEWEMGARSSLRST